MLRPDEKLYKIDFFVEGMGELVEFPPFPIKMCV